MLEASQHHDNSFVTLTYDEEALPRDNSVSPREVGLFIKRFRKILDNKGRGRIRYFAVGEYGETSGRPHYHLAVFGHGECKGSLCGSGYLCEQCEIVDKAWGKGRILVGDLNAHSAAYVGGYVTKKWTKAKDLPNRAPEFARMSLRPAIGLFAAHEIASTLMMHGHDERMIDVPLSLQHGRAKWPLGRYLRRELRRYCGREKHTPPLALAAQAAELQDVREAAWSSKKSVKAEILERSLGRRIQIESKERRKKRETV